MSIEHRRAWRLHPLPAALLAATMTLYAGAMLGDLAYASTYQIQWTNFASWLLVGGLVLGAVVCAWTAVDLVRGHRGGAIVAGFVLVLAAWIVGVFNTLVHARDAWAIMPAGLVLSVIAFLLAFAATWLGFSGLRAGDRR